MRRVPVAYAQYGRRHHGRGDLACIRVVLNSQFAAVVGPGEWIAVVRSDTARLAFASVRDSDRRARSYREITN